MISGRISPPRYEAFIKVVESGFYVDAPDYLIDLIKNDLESRGLGSNLKE